MEGKIVMPRSKGLLSKFFSSIFSRSNVNSQRVSIFIDGSNLYHSLDENCKRFDLDFYAFAQKLCASRKLTRIYYYNVQRDPDRGKQAFEDQLKFLTALKDIPHLEIRLGLSKARGDITVEKGVDIMIATDILQYAWNSSYDVAILVSGDGDFSYAVQSAKNSGAQVEVAAFSSNLSSELANSADYCKILTVPYFKYLWTKNRRPKKHNGPYRNNEKNRPFLRSNKNGPHKNNNSF